MKSIFVNKESLAYVPKLVGKPVNPMGGMTNYSDSGGDLLHIFLPKNSDTNEVYLGRNGVKDLYRTYHADGTVTVLPYLPDKELIGEPLKEGVEAVKLTFVTDKPISLHAKKPVEVKVIPDELLKGKDEFENPLRDVLSIISPELQLSQAPVGSTVIGLSDLENSPKLLDIQEVDDLLQEFSVSNTKNLLEYARLNDLPVTVDALYNNFLKANDSNLELVSDKLTLRDCITLDRVGANDRDRFIQLIYQALLMKLSNDNLQYFLDVNLILPMSVNDGTSFKPAILIQDYNDVYLLRLSRQGKEVLSFPSMLAMSTYLEEVEGFTHIAKNSLNAGLIEGVLTYFNLRSFSEISQPALVDLLLTEDEAVSEEVNLLTEAASPADRSKRKKIEKLMKEVFNTLDKSGLNTKRYQEELFSLDDNLFFKFINKLINDPRKNLELEVLPGKNEPNLEDIKAALDVLKVPETEYVYMRHEGDKDNPLRSRYRQTVGYIHIRRLQQLLSKKNTYSLSIKQRNLKNNQVTGHDAIAKILVMLNSLNCWKLLRALDTTV